MIGDGCKHRVLGVARERSPCAWVRSPSRLCTQAARAQERETGEADELLVGLRLTWSLLIECEREGMPRKGLEQPYIRATKATNNLQACPRVKAICTTGGKYKAHYAPKQWSCSAQRRGENVVMFSRRHKIAFSIPKERGAILFRSGKISRRRGKGPRTRKELPGASTPPTQKHAGSCRTLPPHGLVRLTLAEKKGRVHPHGTEKEAHGRNGLDPGKILKRGSRCFWRKNDVDAPQARTKTKALAFLGGTGSCFPPLSR